MHYRISLLSCLFALFSIGTTQAAEIGQTVTVTTQFNDIVQPAAFWVEVRDPNAGSVRPFFLRLDMPSQSSVYSTQSNDYFINRIWLQFDDGAVIHPCQFSKEMLNQRSVNILLKGVLDHHFSRPECYVKAIKSMPINAQIHDDRNELTIVEEEDRLLSDEGLYYDNLKNCEPSAFQFTAYQPYVDKVLQTTSIIEGLQGNECLVSIENKFQSDDGPNVHAVTRCRFSNATRKAMSAGNIDRILQTSQEPASARNNLYVRAMCNECGASASGKVLKCFESFSKQSEENKATS